jgi:hypothetical protein
MLTVRGEMTDQVIGLKLGAETLTGRGSISPGAVLFTQKGLQIIQTKLTKIFHEIYPDLTSRY